MRKINKLLVANRGEIALRVLRSAKEMGITTVAIYSEADRLAPHVRYADEAVCVGPPASAQSYLRGDKIIAICHQLGVDAIHPGYGFLSENAGFARAVRAAGLLFVGPSPEAMELMGDKLSAKQAVKAYNIPLVPGTDEAITDVAAATRIAEQVGFPVLIKASAGGGGKGMRLVQNSAEFEEQMQLAVNEATSAFGDGAVFIEKFVSGPRHIEIQVLGDEHGNIVHLFERECSIQRRHQKVIEEAPSSVLTPELRAEMGRAAVEVARACRYSGAGTVEFLLDDQHRFYFLEMNTRLQVEHPVTEQITGLDLVKEQIRVAEGQPLPFRQQDLQMRGHAIELRVYAEDPQNNFLPDIGRLSTYVRPQGPGVRVDDGFEQGMDIPIYYDPMIAKLVATGATRAEAIERLLRAIQEFQITGIETTLPFGAFVLRHPAFVSGNFDTNFVRDHFTAAALAPTPPDESTAQVAAALVAMLLHEQQPAAVAPTEASGALGSAWRRNRLGAG
ncbi:MAG: acetyl-CoA carboxylase biotin carboxylase subunit [Janthinobacterium lividum]